jgi:hypothetical protein
LLVTKLGGGESRGWRAACALLAFGASLGFFLFASAGRPFWNDEEIQFVDTFTYSVWDMLKNGANGQCSPPPLYYIFMKAWMKVSALSPLSVDPLVSMRLPSAISASVFFGALAWFWGSAGLVAAGLIFHDSILPLHATEARPYAIWVFLSFFFLLAYPRRDGAGKRGLAIFALLGALLGMLTSGSVFLLIAVLGWTLLFRRRQWKRISLALLPGFLVVAYYLVFAQTVCTNFSGTEGMHSLMASLRRGDYSLVKATLGLFISKSPLAFPVYLSAVASAIYFWRKREAWSPENRDQLAFVAAVTSLAFFGAAAAVIYQNYYFVPRVFIFVLAGKGILLALLLSLAARALREKLTNPTLKLVAAAVLLLYVGFLFYVKVVGFRAS